MERWKLLSSREVTVPQPEPGDRRDELAEHGQDSLPRAGRGRCQAWEPVMVSPLLHSGLMGQADKGNSASVRLEV